MRFMEALDIRPGVTAVIGSGGKTGLLRRLAQEAPGTVILCTTTHIRPFSEYPVLENPSPSDIRQALKTDRVLCVGIPAHGGKLTAAALPPAHLAEVADYVLTEADGSRQLPLKAHADHEPVIPAGCRQVICVVGASGLGRPIREAVHRPEHFCALTGAAETDVVTPELAASALLKEGLCGTVFLNQLDTPSRLPAAQRFAAALAGHGLQIWGGSLRNGTIFPL